jgi:probable F420-dependent oxidoreductase
MKIGLTMFATDESMEVIDLAMAAEERSFHSLYVPEHTHIPTSRRTPPPSGEAELAEEYRRTLDPFVALAAAAAVTGKLLVGTGICLVAQRDPIVLAKEVASLDLISAGRFVLGIGFGWNEDEMENHGVAFRARRDIVREKTLAMCELWSKDAASFRGKHVSFTESWSWPKPVQRPRPPILIGGAAGPKLFAHIAEYADGWMPIGGAGVAAALPELRAAVEKAGRDPNRIRVVPFGTIPDRGKLEYYESLGIDEVVLRLPSESADVILPILDEFEKQGFNNPT